MLKILIVDDEQEISNALKNFFSDKGYRVFMACDGKAALESVKKNRPHLVFLDIRMPHMDGLTVLRHICEFDRSIKVIMVTAFGTQEIINESLRIGAVDFVKKPFTFDYLEREVTAKVNVQLFGQLRNEIDEKDKLIAQLKKLNKRLARNFYQTILSLASALESRDRYTLGHSERVCFYSKLIAYELKNSSKSLEIGHKFLNNLNIEARLHDIGKIAVPDEILHKAGRLTDEEFEIIKIHPAESAKILSPLEGVKDNVDVIYSHHERVDGKGYPERKIAQQIPLRAKIIAVADAFDAMTSDRPYRKAMDVEDAFKELEKNIDLQFEGNLVHTFITAYKRTTAENDAGCLDITLRRDDG